MPPADEPPLAFSVPGPLRRALLALAAAATLSCARGAEASLVGDTVCSACHQAKAHSFHDTAHFRTSSLASAENVHGRFTADANTLQTINPNLTFVMESNEKGYFQTAHMKTSATEELTRSERFDVVVGSGRKGQTYLFWDGDQLFQLPISYWTELDGWVNSPGYIDGTADFERPIVPRCLECHSSSHVAKGPPENRYDTASLVLGVTCEKCHGPGSEHVARFQSSTPPSRPADFAIVNPARLSRSKQLDICALCHEGAGESLQPPLSFKPGDDLSQFIAFAKIAPHARVDVHAAQVQLLKMSRCFRSSTTLTCTTCHDVHVAQRDTAPFAAKCLGCHKVENCGEFASKGHAIDNRCIDCHMPLQETGKIVSRVDGLTVRPKVRNHHIAIYRDAAAP
jgi:hypothetical protein